MSKTAIADEMVAIRKRVWDGTLTEDMALLALNILASDLLRDGKMLGVSRVIRDIVDAWVVERDAKNES